MSGPPMVLSATSDGFPPMHRLFIIPELVTAIIRELAWMQPLVRGPLTVCKLWADIVMDLIWHDINDLRTIFRLLAPIEEQPSDDEDVVHELYCSFKTLPTPSGWACFDLYRRRVRALDNNHDETLYMSFRAVINDIAVLRPDSMAFFPNLTELFWSYVHGDLWRESVFFMHKGIKKLSLMLWLGEPGGQETILQYFEHIAMRMPHLQSFNLNLCPYDASAESQSPIGPALSWLLPKLRYLTALTLPPMVDAYAVISSTASLPNLQTINANIDVTIDKTLFSVSTPNPPTSNVTLSYGLQSLSLGISYSDAATHLLCTEFPALTKLFLWSHKPESQICTRTLTRAIVLRCQSLRDISLIADTADGFDLPPDGCITLADIQPLFGCRNVVRFSIAHSLPLQLTNDDITNLLRNWGSVVDLSLNHSPSPSHVLPPDASEPYFNWETLAVVAEHGGHLEHLGLHLDGFAKIPPCAGITPLPKLKQLSVGTSKLPSSMKDVLGPARFLSQFLTLQCRVQCSYKCPDCIGWTTLSELLDSFIRVRMEEKELARTQTR
ncbi:hypothetical protein EDD18DRAFT_1134057 [Armillaria luteobubalina]|uniref:F-box domain-containing protein n=1 Tax=Armillaria luteobubalina TaxID=153913 RepID=A0AA39QMR6_9AGAR|nr:hypothetical protein EDD18DRAFT_1134057 [Armillaria luteobubalina]